MAIKALILMAILQIKPQPGFQTQYLSSPADIVIGGAAAGVGKSFALLMDPLRNTSVPQYNAVIFRRTMEQVKQAGGLWDTSMDLYSIAKGRPNIQRAEWSWGDREKSAKIKFAHLQYEKDVLTWQGSQIAYLGFDELDHFTRRQFFYMLSRNRSVSGVRPCVRATCNPNPDSWLITHNGEWGKGLIGYWIDPDTGFPIEERVGKLRYFTLSGDNYIWGDTPAEVVARVPEQFKHESNPEKLVKSITFIPGKITDNVELLQKDPQYLANLYAQDDATRAALLDGNWKIRPDDDSMMVKYPEAIAAFENSFVGRNAEGELMKLPKYITADIAMEGSDRFVILVWAGWRVIDTMVMDKSGGKQIIKAIKSMAELHQVPRQNIIYDSDGVGKFIDSYLVGSKAFVNGAKPKNSEQFLNLKTQCAYFLKDKFNEGELYITPLAASYKTSEGTTTKEHIIRELKCLKRDRMEYDGKLRIIGKEVMKEINGKSPDFLDALIMRALPDISITHKRIV